MQCPDARCSQNQGPLLTSDQVVYTRVSEDKLEPMVLLLYMQ